MHIFILIFSSYRTKVGPFTNRTVKYQAQGKFHNLRLNTINRLHWGKWVLAKKTGSARDFTRPSPSHYPTEVFHWLMGFPGDSGNKEFTCNVGDMGSIPGLGKSFWRREWLSSPVFLPSGERNATHPSILA